MTSTEIAPIAQSAAEATPSTLVPAHSICCKSITSPLMARSLPEADSDIAEGAGIVMVRPTLA